MKVKADTLFYGGKIYTMEAPGVCKEAVVLKLSLIHISEPTRPY